ncbi:hypothetical protein L209DRAFT_754835 [Thermothelomyces heterothallicus CBS 203.75]
MATHLPAGLSPDAVDVVTELSSIITRLRAAQQSSSPSGANATGATAASAGGGGNKPPTSGATPIPQGGVTGTTHLPTSAPTPNPSSSNNTITNSNTANAAAAVAASSSTAGAANPNPNQQSTTGSGPGSADKELLSVKDLPFATDNLKHKLQRARAAVRMLGDVRRALAQQEAEARALEERRARQAARLARTQEDGLLFVKAKREESEGVVVMGDMDVDDGGGGAGKERDGNGQAGAGERMVE